MHAPLSLMQTVKVQSEIDKLNFIEMQQEVTQLVHINQHMCGHILR